MYSYDCDDMSRIVLRGRGLQKFGRVEREKIADERKEVGAAERYNHCAILSGMA